MSNSESYTHRGGVAKGEGVVEVMCKEVLSGKCDKHFRFVHVNVYNYTDL